MHHVGLEMASSAGIDLHGRRTRSPNPLAIVHGRLVPLDHIELELTLEIANRSLQQRGLAGSRRTDQVQRENFPACEPGPVLRRQRIVLGEDARLEFNDTVVCMRVMVVIVAVVMMPVIVGVAVPRAIGMSMIVLVSMAVIMFAVGMAMAGPVGVDVIMPVGVTVLMIVAMVMMVAVPGAISVNVVMLMVMSVIV